jgi:hypothetical protein
MTLDVAETPAPASYADLATLLDATTNHNELLQESVADLELAAEDRGWQRMAFGLEHQFTRQGLNDIARNCRVMALASPLIKRGTQLRIGYVWGQGVTVQARAGSDAAQDVNAVITAFWDDESNQASFTSSQAQEENERALATDGNVILALFTDPSTGRVQVRSTPFEEVTDKITNPEDRDETWFFLRQYDTTVVRPFQPARGPLTTRTRAMTVKVLHPALGYRPARRPRSIDGVEIMWDAPMLHVPVNRLDGWKWGVPDTYAALPWGRAYDGFLTDWARLVKALSKFAWKLTGDKSSRARRAADTMRAALPAAVLPGMSDAGNVAAMGPGQNLEAIPKTGATIDSESGRPLAAMVAAAMGVSVVSLLADPGTTGNRATAETLDKPTILEMGMRRMLWASVIETVTGYVIDQAVKAPRGPLRGTTTRDPYTGRETVTLTGDVPRTVTVDWPDLNELDPVKLVNAIVAADTTRKLPPLETARLLMHALRVKDVDDLLEDLTDEQGNWIDPDATAGDQAVQRFRRGEDPADV